MNGQPELTIIMPVYNMEKYIAKALDQLAKQEDPNFKLITVTGSDLVKYLNPSGDNFTTNSGVWSSAMIQKTSAGSGINV